MNEQVLKQIVAKPSSLQKSEKLALIRKSFSEGQPNRSIPIKFAIQLKLNGVKRELFFKLNYYLGGFGLLSETIAWSHGESASKKKPKRSTENKG